MPKLRPSAATTFISILTLGALAVAIVVIAVSLTASAGEQIADAERDVAAVDLLEQRQAVTSLFAEELAATVMDEIQGPESMEADAVTAQRLTAVEAAMDTVGGLADRGDSVGNESQRWITAMASMREPTSASFPHRLLINYDGAINVSCCAGVVPSDAHHTAEQRTLEAAAELTYSRWHDFYIAVQISTGDSAELKPLRDFLDHAGATDRLPPEAELPSDELSRTLPTLGVSREAINAFLTSDAVATLDAVIANAKGVTTDPVPVEEAYAAAGAAYRSLDELFTQAVEATRARLANEMEQAEQTRLLALTICPLLLVVLAGVGFVVYRFSRSRERALERERELVDARNRFMRMVSHELRTPATAISGFADMLTTDWTSLTEPEIAEFLAIISRQSTHLTLIVDDLLTLSHLETGRLRLHLAQVNLNQAAEDAISMVEGRYGIDVETTIDPSITLLADPDRLVQILRNLVENAAKYGKVGVAVTAAVVGASCEIVVSDTGPGVQPDMVERIFRFWDRGEKDGSRVRGYGMGLAIARHLARAMVGDLVYRPHQPMGSEFVLSLRLGSPDSMQPKSSDAATTPATI
jgi:two-component system phosphate regulon sensor histidine kinase PhoR